MNDLNNACKLSSLESVITSFIHYNDLMFIIIIWTTEHQNIQVSKSQQSDLSNIFYIIIICMF